MIIADVLILGNGIAAFTTALLLKKSGIDNVVVAGKNRKANRVHSETLPFAALTLLNAAGIGDIVEKHPLSEGMLSSWGEDRVLVKETLFEIFSAGWQIDKTVFVEDCYQCALQNGISYLSMDSLHTAAQHANATWHLQFIQDDRIIRVTALFVVDATGRDCAFGRLQGARRVLFDRQTAITAVYSKAEAPASKVSSVIESLPCGWCYSALLSSSERFVTLFSDPSIVKHGRLTESSEWHCLLLKTKLISSFLRHFSIKTFSVCPASTSFLFPGAGKGWLAVGDALFTVDPLSSGGNMNALYTAVSAVPFILTCLQGKNESLVDYYAIHRKRVEDFLEQQNQMYESEKRWAGQDFWKSRQNAIHLDPHLVVGLASAENTERTVRHLEHYLTPPEWKHLLSLCREPVCVYKVVSAFHDAEPVIPIRRVISLLQFLLDKKILQPVIRPPDFANLVTEYRHDPLLQQVKVL